MKYSGWWKRLRFRIGSAVIGDGWAGVVTRLWLIRDRAMAAVSKDGYVTLAKCPGLAEALYEPMPGTWSLTVERVTATLGLSSTCGFVPPTPGYAPCTRPRVRSGAIGHDGPCPHRFGTTV